MGRNGGHQWGISMAAYGEILMATDRGPGGGRVSERTHRLSITLLRGGPQRGPGGSYLLRSGPGRLPPLLRGGPQRGPGGWTPAKTGSSQNRSLLRGGPQRGPGGQRSSVGTTPPTRFYGEVPSGDLVVRPSTKQDEGASGDLLLRGGPQRGPGGRPSSRRRTRAGQGFYGEVPSGDLVGAREGTSALRRPAHASTGRSPAGTWWL